MSESNTVRVRFAPSPTGPLHIGGVRTALYNYLFARHAGGTMILRIEDTDSKRYVPGSEAYIVEALQWLNIQIDEGVSQGGDYGPYRQSERKEIYKKYIDQLLEQDKAYLAFDSPEQLEAKRAEDPNFQYDASSRLSMLNSLTLSATEVEERLQGGEDYTVRFKIEPDRSIEVQDMIRGRVVFNSSVLDDKVLYKSADQLPTYHLANVVDDHLMKISHVIRGEEWLPSTPLHVLLYEALGWDKQMPLFAHLPLLLKPDGKGKLSKRDGDRLDFPVFPLNWEDPQSGEISKGYREAGYFPQAVINFLALLGWNPGDNREMFSMDQLIEAFTIERCSKSGAKFDYEKARWFNHQYMQELDNSTLAESLLPLIEAKGYKTSPGFVEAILVHIKERMVFPHDFWDQAAYFFAAPDQYDAKTVAKRWKPESAAQLTELVDLLERINDYSNPEAIESEVKAWIEQKSYKMGLIMNAFRLALVGEGKGPGMFDIVCLLGKEETLQRLRKAIITLG
ncbi:MAG: glutamate--tRNA ligase [Bacteroidales bacterium]|jgi:glutamyl-tRNA synthetase|nr:glutamate--tRNA ligase [Bacteroidales bacterium]MDI9545584.1 glutamate--tRNA ligase [Bacteroidota bacterium]OQC02385.1 MAG: Glutamate--tRNA ligase [Bacteroidetes bacterium ADurb.Bin090]MBP8981893.1 glutamate--tRNA ligase [Bacteroidales bacterium]NLV39393.1 glutamate--tRNA ligase [Bacteroidales bacterium]